VVIDNRTNTCFEPVFHGGLDNFYRYHPRGTLFLSIRKVEDWVDSVNNHNDLGNRFRSTCKKPGYFATHWGNKNVTEADMAQLYRDHVQTVRDFAAAHPSLTYIEVSLESNETGMILQNRTGIPSTCWIDANSRNHSLTEDALDGAVANR
jgi:hypothetical protein